MFKWRHAIFLNWTFIIGCDDVSCGPDDPKKDCGRQTPKK